MNNNDIEKNKLNIADNHLLADYFDSFFSIYSKKLIGKFINNNYKNYNKEILDTLSIKDLLQVELGKNEQNNENEKFIVNKNNNNDDIIMEDIKEKDDENENIYEEIKEFISFDKNNKNKKDKTNKRDNSIDNKNNSYNIYNRPKIFEYDFKNNYYSIHNYNQNNIKTIKGSSPDRTNNSFDNYPPFLIKNPYDNFECQNHANYIRHNFIKNNIFKNQQFQGNHLFNFNKQYEKNSFLLEPQNSYCLQKTIPLPYNNQNNIFPNNHHNSNNSPSFYSKINEKNNQYNYFSLANNFAPLLKTIQNNNYSFINTFNFPSFVNNEIKHENLFNYNDIINSNPVSPTTSQEKPKQKLKKKLFIKNNKIIFLK